MFNGCPSLQTGTHDCFVAEMGRIVVPSRADLQYVLTAVIRPNIFLADLILITLRYSFPMEAIREQVMSGGGDGYTGRPNFWPRLLNKLK